MTTADYSAVEEPDRYVLPLTGRQVSRCYVDYGFGLCFYEAAPSTKIRIEGEMRLTRNGQIEALIDPGPGAGAGPDPRSLGPLLILFRKTVISANALKTGELHILFEEDLRLEVAPGTKYEPWEISASNGLKFFSLPGGSLAYFKPLVS